MKNDRVYTLLAVAVLTLTTVPVGAAVFVLGFLQGDSPCIMCWQQRSGMAIVSLIGLFVLRYGPRPRYLGLAVLVSAWGLFMAARHTALHAARDVGQGFSVEILGAHTYTWSSFVYGTCIVTVGLLMLALKDRDLSTGVRELGRLDAVAMAVFLVVAAANAIQAFASTGPPPFVGQSDPVRFSFAPRNWVWSLEEWLPAPVSLRGRWAVEKPDLASVPAGPDPGLDADLPVLKERGRLTPGLPLRGTVTDLAHDPGTDRFLLTTQQGIYLATASFGALLRHTVVDTGFSVDLGRFGGAAFLDSRTIMALGENKSYVILREGDGSGAGRNYRYFLESPADFDEVSRSRLATVRAKMMYVMSLAADPASDSLYTVTVPNSKTRKLVVSRFDRRDMMLSEEFTPGLSPALPEGLRSGKWKLDDLFVTGVTVAGGRMLAVSAARGLVLSIDLARHLVAGVYRVPGLVAPTGIAVRERRLYIAASDGTIRITDSPE